MRILKIYNTKDEARDMFQNKCKWLKDHTSENYFARKLELTISYGTKLSDNFMLFVGVDSPIDRIRGMDFDLCIIDSGADVPDDLFGCLVPHCRTILGNKK